MDPVTSVFSITVNIAKFISAHGDKTALQENILNTVTLVQEVIDPLRTHQNYYNDQALSDILGTVEFKLKTIDNHLRSWKTSWIRRTIAFCYPWAVTKQIEDDTEQLMNAVRLLDLVMNRQTNDVVRGFMVFPSTNNTTAIPVHPTTSAHSQMSVVPDEDEVLRFWHSRIGGDQVIAKSQQLCDDLESWLNLNLQGLARRRLLLRFDENQSGNVTLRTLQSLARDRKLREAIVLYSSDPDFPLLIWVSDDLKINAPKVAFAQRQGVSVIQLATTSSAKAWINVNKNFLQKHDNAADLRFISDQSRWELDSNNKPFFNHKAGNEIIKYIRAEGFKAPVLIYTSENTVPATRYVESYENAGSTANYEAYKNYVLALASRRNDDRDWMRCPAPPAKPVQPAKPANPAQPINPAPPAKPVHLVKPAHPAQPK